jgi:hypothetical protein
MANGFTITLDTAKLERALSNGLSGLPDQIKQSMGDIMDAWKREAVNIALKDKGTLRQGISVEVTGTSDTFEGLIKSVAIEQSGKWGAFNYAYYWHEHKKEVKNPTTAGTVAQYMDKSGDDNMAKWQTQLEDDIDRYITKMGG